MFLIRPIKTQVLLVMVFALLYLRFTFLEAQTAAERF